MPLFCRIKHLLFIYITKPNSTTQTETTTTTSARKRRKKNMLKLRSKRFCRSISKLASMSSKNGGGGSTSPKGSEKGSSCGGSGAGGEVKWEVRPGGMLVQKRDVNGGSDQEEVITIRVSTVSTWHDISIEATSTFGELKMILSLVCGLEVREQRILYKGKEREDREYLHMVGIKDKDKVLLLQDPAIKEMKLHGMSMNCRTITV